MHSNPIGLRAFLTPCRGKDILQNRVQIRAVRLRLDSVETQRRAWKFATTRESNLFCVDFTEQHRGCSLRIIQFASRCGKLCGGSKLPPYRAQNDKLRKPRKHTCTPLATVFDFAQIRKGTQPVIICNIFSKNILKIQKKNGAHSAYSQIFN